MLILYFFILWHHIIYNSLPLCLAKYISPKSCFIQGVRGSNGRSGKLFIQQIFCSWLPDRLHFFPHFFPYTIHLILFAKIVSFTSFWDNIENIPKLCGESINFGMPSVVGVLGTLCVTNRVELSQHNPFFPEILSGNINPFIYFPLLHHTVLNILSFSRFIFSFFLPCPKSIYYYFFSP